MKSLPPPSDVIKNCPSYSTHYESNKYAIFLAAGYTSAIVPFAENYLPSGSIMNAYDAPPELSNIREIPAMLNYPVLYHKLAIEYLRRLKFADKSSDEYAIMNKKAEWAINMAQNANEKEWHSLHAIHLYLSGDEDSAKNMAQSVLRQDLPLRYECELLLDLLDKDKRQYIDPYLEVEPDSTKVTLGVVLCFILPLIGIYILYKERKERKERAMRLQLSNPTTYVTGNEGVGATPWTCPIPDTQFPLHLLEPEPSSEDLLRETMQNPTFAKSKTNAFIKEWWNWYDRNQKFICHERINNWAILKERVLAGDESAKFMMNALGFTMESHNNGIATLGNPINEQAGVIQNLIAYWVPYELI